MWRVRGLSRISLSYNVLPLFSADASIYVSFSPSYRELLEAGRYEINGETYIPGTAIEEYNAKYRTNFDAKDIDFHISI